MRSEVVDELERFIGSEGLWSDDGLAAMVARLESEAESDIVCRGLAANLTAVQRRQRSGPVPIRLVADIEGVLYPRLWKVMEAVWDGLPTAEVSIRLHALDERLAPLLEEG